MNTLKKLLSIILLFSLFSCSSVQKNSGASKNKINGSWGLFNIEYNNTKGKFKSTLFNDADLACFIGSQWSFIGNNNSGNYTIRSNEKCSGATRQIKWDIIKEGEIQYFQFKRLEEGVKSKAISTGYRLQLAMVTENSIQMIQNVDVNGKVFKLIYTFAKNNTKK
jgi:hypothetical protein